LFPHKSRHRKRKRRYRWLILALLVAAFSEATVDYRIAERGRRARAGRRLQPYSITEQPLTRRAWFSLPATTPPPAGPTLSPSLLTARDRLPPKLWAQYTGKDDDPPPPNDPRLAVDLFPALAHHAHTAPGGAAPPALAETVRWSGAQWNRAMPGGLLPWPLNPATQEHTTAGAPDTLEDEPIDPLPFPTTWHPREPDYRPGFNDVIVLPGPAAADLAVKIFWTGVPPSFFVESPYMPAEFFPGFRMGTPVAGEIGDTEGAPEPVPAMLEFTALVLLAGVRSLRK